MSQFEQYVFWRKSKYQTNYEEPPCEDNELQNTENSDLRKWLWWEPPGDSWLQDFFGYSAIHGLKYISKRKLSFFERIFWIVSFVASLCGSGVMIAEVWDRYHKSPVIVSFNPTEEETFRIPFPAVTICNKSLFSKAKIIELYEQLNNATLRNKTMEKLRLAHALCTTRQSFLRRMNLVRPESDWTDVNVPPSQKSLDKITNFIFENTQPCSQLIRACSWDRRKRNCGELFKSIVTDYGRCCVFNKIPNELMDFESGHVDRERGWSFDEIMEWKKWDYSNDGFLINNSLKYPLRQKRAGSLNGLSLIIDPDVDNGYCQSQDSLGVRILFHTPADAPRISHMGTGVGLEREIFMKVFPDSTIADQNILDYEFERRKCIFGKGRTLEQGDDIVKVYRPYTRNNCFITCQQRHIREICNCTLHYAGRIPGVRVCNPSINSPDYRCARDVEVALAGNLKRDCSMCVYACNYLKYNVESTEANLLDPADLWGDNETNQPPSWSEHKLSIIHIFMGSEMHVPKVRQKLYDSVDLIASIGGLLSLTLGFSVLAAIEILYLLTLRICCKRFRKWHMDSPPEIVVDRTK